MARKLILGALLLASVLALAGNASAGNCYSNCYSRAYVAPTYCAAYPTYSYSNYAPTYHYTYSPAGWAYGRWYPAGYYYWDGYQFYLQGYGAFAGYPTAPAEYAQPTSVPAYSADWRTGVLKYAEKQNDLVAYQQALGALGIKGQQYFSGIANQFPLGAGYINQAVIGTYGTSGNTIYGQTYQQATQVSPVDLNALTQIVRENNQSAWRYGEHALDASTAAGGAAQTLTQQLNDGVSNAAQLYARAHASREVATAGAIAYKATEPASVARSTTTVTTTGTTGGVGATYTQPTQPGSIQPQSVPAGELSDADFQAKVVNNRCAACHSGANPKGNLSLANYAALDRATKLKCIAVTSPKVDPGHRMPKSGDGSAPGEVLPVEEWVLFLSH